jgi:hypothetical protein
MTDEHDKPENEMNDRRGWHFDRRVTLGELCTFLGLVAMFYFKGNAVIDEFRQANTQMDKRVSILEERASTQKQIDQAQDNTVRDGQARIETQLTDIQRYLRDPSRPKP